MPRSLMLVLAVSAAFATVACSPTVSRHGYQVGQVGAMAVEEVKDPRDPKNIVAGQDTRTTVMTKLGTPSQTATFEPNIWYYVSQTVESLTYHKDKTLSREVTVITFDKTTDMVTEVKTLGLADGKVVAFNGRKTPTRGRELTIIEQLLGSVGRQALPEDDAANGPGGRRRE